MRLGKGRVLQQMDIPEVAMLGMGPTCAHWLHRQFGQPKFISMPVWTINQGCFAFRTDLCFDMHTADVLAGEETYEFAKTAIDPDGAWKKAWDSGAFSGITREYKRSGVPVVTPDGHDGTLEYPIAEIVEKFQTNYFTCGAAYMIAYALYCGAKKLYLFGFDFAYGDEAAPIEPGRACVEYWLGRATERGVQFEIPGDSTLLSQSELAKKGLYGYGFRQPIFEIDGGFAKVKGFHDGRRPV